MKNEVINPAFEETTEQRDFRQKFMNRLNAAYRFYESVGIMDLCEDSKISLQDIYVPLRFSTTEIEEGKDWDEQADTVSLLELLKTTPSSVISGRPGSGKTTVSRMVINLLSERALSGLAEECGRRVPLYFKLRDYDLRKVRSSSDLLQQFAEMQSRSLEMSVPKEQLLFYLNQGWCFIIFDGVDEVGGLRIRRKIRKIVLSEFTRFNEANRLLVTSRPSGLKDCPFHSYLTKGEKEGNEITLLPLRYVDSFNKVQAKDFSYKWFSLREENRSVVRNKSRDFITAIERIPSLSALKRRPVFLTMMIHIHTTKGKLPHSRAAAYEYMVQAYIEHLDMTRRLDKTMYKDEAYAEWSFEDKMRLLQVIAYKLHSSSRKGKDSLIVTSRSELLQIIEDAISANEEVLQTIEVQHAKDLLRFYLARTGLLHEPAEDQVQFSHLSFQEYLTARHIYRMVIEQNLLRVAEAVREEIVTRLRADAWPWWGEVVLLFFSLTKEASTDILQVVEEEVLSSNDSGLKSSFCALLLQIVDSEEYGILDSQLKQWVRKLLQAIGQQEASWIQRNRPSEKGAKSIQDYEASWSQAFELSVQFFSSREREHKIAAALACIGDVFDKCLTELRKEETNQALRNQLEGILYFAGQDRDSAEQVREQLVEALPFLLDRGRFGSQFLAGYEIVVSHFIALAEPVSLAYSLSEAFLFKDFLSESVFRQFVKEGQENSHWHQELLAIAWRIENLLAALTLMDLMGIANPVSFDLNNFRYLELLTEVDKDVDAQWRNIWPPNVWHGHKAGLLEATHRNVLRMVSQGWLRHYFQPMNFDSHIVSVLIAELEHYGVDPSPFQVFERNELISVPEGQTVATWRGLSAAVLSCFYTLCSAKKLRQSSGRLADPVLDLETLKRLSPLLHNPSALQKELVERGCTNINRKTFANEYAEYDRLPYSASKLLGLALDQKRLQSESLNIENLLKGAAEVLNRIGTRARHEIQWISAEQYVTGGRTKSVPPYLIE